MEQFNGEVPSNRKDLEALPGVGRKTANVVLNTAFGQPTMAVDTHIFRVGNRTGLAIGKNVLEVEHRLVKVIPKEFILDAHHWLILHGRYCCIARRPKCSECVVADVCNWPDRFEFGAQNKLRLKILRQTKLGIAYTQFGYFKRFCCFLSSFACFVLFSAFCSFDTVKITIVPDSAIPPKSK